jgi:hypothetical protein
MEIFGLVRIKEFLVKSRMQKRILQTGFLSIFMLTLLAACPVITCGCSPAPLASLTLSSNAASVTQGSSTQISIEATDVYDETIWPLTILVKPNEAPQSGNPPQGVSASALLLTKENPKGVLTLSVSKLAAPGSYDLIIYPTSSIQKGLLPFSSFNLKITTQP